MASCLTSSFCLGNLLHLLSEIDVPFAVPQPANIDESNFLVAPEEVRLSQQQELAVVREAKRANLVRRLFPCGKLLTGG